VDAACGHGYGSAIRHSLPRAAVTQYQAALIHGRTWACAVSARQLPDHHSTRRDTECMAEPGHPILKNRCELCILIERVGKLAASRRHPTPATMPTDRERRERVCLATINAAGRVETGHLRPREPRRLPAMAAMSHGTPFAGLRYPSSRAAGRAGLRTCHGARDALLGKRSTGGRKAYDHLTTM